MPDCNKCKLKECNRAVKQDGISFEKCPSFLAGRKDQEIYLCLQQIYASATKLMPMPEDSTEFDQAVYMFDLLEQMKWRRFSEFWARAFSGGK